MKPIDFKQSTKVLQRPSTMTDAECASLHVWSDGKQCVSCWKPSVMERLKILFYGKVWLGVNSGGTQPPVFVSGHAVFNKPSLKARISAFFSNLWSNTKNAVKSLKNHAKEPDKRKHFIVGLSISVLIGIFLPLGGFILGCVAGALKEWWDSKGHGVVELMDFIFTALGALVGSPIAWVIHALIF